MAYVFSQAIIGTTQVIPCRTPAILQCVAGFENSSRVRNASLSVLELERKGKIMLVSVFLDFPNHTGNIAMKSSPFEEFEEQE